MKQIALLMLGLAGAVGAQTAGGLGIFEGAADVGSPAHKGSVVYDAVRKAKVDGQDFFEAAAIEQLIWNGSGNTENWHFTLQLKHAEAAP